MSDVQVTAEPTRGAAGGDAPVLEVARLGVGYGRGEARVQVLRDVTFSVAPGEILGVVGESASGKSTLALTLTRLVDHVGGEIAEGSSIRVCGRELVGADPAQVIAVRRHDVGMVFQDPLSALNPVQTVGRQIGEAVLFGGGPTYRAARRQRAIELLDDLGIDQPHVRVDNYPHELSGGMRQRVVIAIALASQPRLLIADEPTTALDVTVRRRILDLLKEKSRAQNISLILVSHDMATIRAYTDRMVVMYAGRVVEAGRTAELHDSPQHPYTSGLIRSVPRLGGGAGQRLVSIDGAPPRLADLPPGCSFAPRCPHDDRTRCVTEVPAARSVGAATVRCHHPGRGFELRQRTAAARPAPQAGTEPILRVENLVKRYRIGRLGQRRWFEAVAGVSFDVAPGETFGLVGESGSGKSTVARCVTLLARPSSGAISFAGRPLRDLSARAARALTRQVQIVFQNPGASLDPRWKVRSFVAEPMKVHGLWGRDGFTEARVAELLERVGLRPEDGDRYPHEFSGGQRQRIALARALSVGPTLLVLDEPVSSLDVSIRAGIINLLQDLQADLGLSYLFIAHDLPLVESFCDRVAVMRTGRIVEQGTTAQVFRDPRHSYTRELLDAEL